MRAAIQRRPTQIIVWVGRRLTQINADHFWLGPLDSDYSGSCQK